LVAGLLVLALVPMQVAWAADAAGSEAPVLPDAVQLVIGAAVTFLVVAGLKDFLQFTGHDLTGWGTVIAAAATATIIFAINMAIQVAVTIDPSLVPKINAFFQILVILLGAMGFKRLQRAGPQENVGTK
jgi:hypothetical protein